MTKTTDQTPALQRVSVSAVVPVYAGKAYLERLVGGFDALRSQWADAGAPLELAEVILVDDCGIDGSAELADQLASTHAWVVSLHLSRNSGQHAATIAGILHSSGDWVVTLDEDLQHPPERIPDMLRKAVESGGDIIYAQAKSSVHQTLSRDMSSRGTKRLIAWLSGNKNISYFNSFRLVRGSVARAAASVCSHDTYFDIVLSWFTERVHPIAMDLKDERFIRTGKSGYRMRTLISHARRLIFTGQLKILRLGALLGLTVVVVSMFAALGVLVSKVLYPSSMAVVGWTSLFLTVSFFGGLITLMLGLVMEYMSTLMLRSNGRPLFFTVDRASDRIVRDYFQAAAR